MAWLIHSQKGSEWKKHQYIKREGTAGKLEDDGKYYYPDSYEGGRHLPKGDSQRKFKRNGADNDDNAEDWEKKVHDHLSKIIEDHPDLFKNGTDVAAGIMDPKNFNAVKNTLKAFGVDVDKMSDEEIKNYRKKIADYYDKDYKPKEEEKKATSASSKKKKKIEEQKEDTKKEETKEEDKKEEKQTKTSNSSKSKKSAVEKAVYYGGKASSVRHSELFHYGILGMHWGVRRYQNTDGSLTSAGRQRYSSAKNRLSRSLGSRNTKTMREARRENLSELSDEKLNKYNKRLENERKFADLTKGSAYEGKRFITGIGREAAKIALSGIAIAAGKKIVDKAIESGSIAIYRHVAKQALKRIVR